MTFKKDLTRIITVAVAEGALSSATGLPDPMTRSLISAGVFAAVQMAPIENFLLFQQNKQLSDVVLSAAAISIAQPFVLGEEATQNFVPRFLYELAVVSAGVFGSDLLYGAMDAAQPRSVIIS